MAKNIPLTHKYCFGYLKVYWNKILFFSVYLEDFTGLQAWENNGLYAIKLYSNGQEMKLEFDTIEKWKAVLELLDKATEQK